MLHLLVIGLFYCWILDSSVVRPSQGVLDMTGVRRIVCPYSWSAGMLDAIIADWSVYMIAAYPIWIRIAYISY